MAKGLPNSHRYIKDLQEPLSFSSDGKFRILHLTDIHEVDPEMDDDENRLIPENRTKETMNVIERCLEEAKPDLVVFGGDNISGYWQEFTYDYMYKTIKRIVEPIKKRNIPLAIVFGNHDAEAEYALPFLNKENQISVYCEYENFRSSFNDEDVFGCANCRYFRATKAALPLTFGALTQTIICATKSTASLKMAAMPKWPHLKSNGMKKEQKN